MLLQIISEKCTHHFKPLAINHQQIIHQVSTESKTFRYFIYLSLNICIFLLNMILSGLQKRYFKVFPLYCSRNDMICTKNFRIHFVRNNWFMRYDLNTMMSVAYIKESLLLSLSITSMGEHFSPTRRVPWSRIEAPSGNHSSAWAPSVLLYLQNSTVHYCKGFGFILYLNK